MSFCACLTEIMEGGFKNAMKIKINEKNHFKGYKVQID